MLLQLLLAHCLSTSYKFQEGDKLSDIAERYGASVDDILKDNGFANETMIQPGDSLLITKGEDVITIRMGNSAFNDDIRYAGSGFMAVCWIGRVNDAKECAEIYTWAVGEDLMRGDGWINDWHMENINRG